MKKLTNHTAGPRGVNLKNGTTRWIDPGQSVEIDPKDIHGDLPDLGKPGEAASSDDAELIEAVQAENEKLKAAVATLTKERDALKAENEKLKK